MLITPTKQMRLFTKVESIVNYNIAMGKKTTYRQLTKPLGHVPCSKYIARSLGRLLWEDIKNGKPLRSAAVVSEITKIPGPGFFDYIEKLMGQKFQSEEEKIEFWQNQIHLIFGKN